MTASSTPIRKTDAEVQSLKENWKADPCWDIEDTEGFEAHRDELIAFREAHEAECERRFTLQLEGIATRERISVEDARALYYAERSGERASDEAVRTLRHLFNNAGLSYPGLDADLGDFVGKVVDAAVASAKVDRIRARASVPVADTAGGPSGC